MSELTEICRKLDQAIEGCERLDYSALAVDNAIFEINYVMKKYCIQSTDMLLVLLRKNREDLAGSIEMIIDMNMRM